MFSCKQYEGGFSLYLRSSYFKAILEPCQGDSKGLFIPRNLMEAQETVQPCQFIFLMRVLVVHMIKFVPIP